MIRKIFTQVLILLALAMIPALLCGMFDKRPLVKNPETLESGEVTLATAQNWGTKVLWLDARAESDFQKDHIPGAILLNEDDWDGLLPAMLNAWSQDKIIVVYCSSLQCQASKEVARRLREDAKLPQVYVLKGGWESWLAAKK